MIKLRIETWHKQRRLLVKSILPISVLFDPKLENMIDGISEFEIINRYCCELKVGNYTILPKF